MKRNPRTIISVLVISLLALSIAQSATSSLASADTGAAVFCPNYYWNGIDLPEELPLTESTLYYIKEMIAWYTGTGCHWLLNGAANLQGYCWTIDHLDTYYDNAIIFTKGHRGTWLGNHFTLCDHYGTDVIDSGHILPRTSTKNTFSFIWHCQTAQNYPSYDDGYGMVGMPYAFTHNNNMQMYGWSGDQVYLGWFWGSPQFLMAAGGSDIWNYAHVAYLFWEPMVFGYTVHDTMDYLANVVFERGTWEETELYWWLVVWGNMGLTLP